MTPASPSSGTFALIVLSALRAKQLARGCVARVAVRPTVARTAQAEIAAGMIDTVEPPPGVTIDSR